MVLYECKSCNYSTELKSNYVRHIKSKKHGRNTDPNYDVLKEITLKTQKDPKKTRNSLAIFAKVPFPLMLTSGDTSYTDVKKTRSHSTKNCISNLRTKKKNSWRF